MKTFMTKPTFEILHDQSACDVLYHTDDQKFTLVKVEADDIVVSVWEGAALLVS